MPSANPTPHPLDAAALDELARKAEAAKAADSAARLYSKEVPDDLWSPQEFQTLLEEVRSTFRDLADALTPDVVLALLASVRGAEAELDDLLDAALTGMREPMTLADAQRVRTMLTHESVRRKKAKVRAARAHPPTKETDDAE